MGLRPPMPAFFGNDDWHQQLLYFSKIARADTESLELIRHLETLEQMLSMRDECNRHLTIRFEIPKFIEPTDLETELRCENVTFRLLDSTSIELTVHDRGSKSHLEQLAKYAFDRSVRSCKSK